MLKYTEKVEFIISKTKKIEDKFHQVYQETKQQIKEISQGNEAKKDFYNEKLTLMQDSDDNFTHIDNIIFNIDFRFDDFFEDKEGRVSFIHYLWCELENNFIDKKTVQEKYPNIFKMSEEITKIQKEFEIDHGYFIVGNYTKKEDDDIGKIFKSVSELEKYLDAIEKKILPLYKNLHNSFINELKQKNPLIEVSNTGIKEQDRNGGRHQEILLKSMNNLYQIVVHSESYEKQSYAILSLINSAGYTVLKNVNPNRDYNIDLSYHRNYNQNSFNSIIEDFKTIIKSIDNINNLSNNSENNLQK